MQIKILSEYGYDEALFGLGLSFGKTSALPFRLFNYSEPYVKMEKLAAKLAGLGKGHDKFLRMLTVTLDITAPLYWWKQFDTYKVGTTAQSESTMHTLMKSKITPASFEGGKMHRLMCWRLNILRLLSDFDGLNRELPHAFLQRRIVQTNYAALRNILEQRKGHKLPAWKAFCSAVSSGVTYPELLA